MFNGTESNQSGHIRLRFGITKLIRSAIHKPLAVTMAVLILPAMSWLECGAMNPGRGSHPFQAEAQTTGGCSSGPSPANAIIQTLCPGGVPYAPDLIQFESDAVSTYLAEHNLPQAAAPLIYQYGRMDLRTEIRGNMETQLLAIINMPAASRTTHQQNLFNWMQSLVQQNEIAEYTAAITEYNRWKADPCDFKLDPTIAAQYQLSYNGLPFCNPLTLLFTGPPVPAPSYFVEYGILNSYGKPAQTTSNFGALVSETQIAVGEVYGIGATVGAALATSVGAGISGFLAYIAPFGAGAVAPELFADVISVAGAMAITAEASVPASLVAGPAAIVFATAVIGVEAGLEVFSSEQSIQDLNNLSSQLATATNTPPDLAAMALDSTGVGTTKINLTLVAQTLPDIPSTAPLPAHQSGIDPDFTLANSSGAATASPSLTYTDWNGISWTAQTSGGWFVQTCNSGSKCPQADSFTASINYVDPSGTKWTASRIGNNFVSTENGAGSLTTVCAGDPTTPIISALNLPTCTSFLSSSIAMNVNGQPTNVSLALPPVFTSSSSLGFTPGQSGSFSITATGQTTPAISLVGSLPSGLSFQPGTGTAQIVYAGAPQGTYQATVVASAGGYQVQQNLTISVAPALAITSPSKFTVSNYGQPVSFLITTTGALPVTWSIGETLPQGLNFTDNRNGTATISGTPVVPAGLQGCLLTVGSGPTLPCGITATNVTGSVTQFVTVNTPPVPVAELVGPPSATFEVGIPNSILLTSFGAVTPLTWYHDPIYFPKWLTVHDNGNGTAELSGTPPAVGTYVFQLYPLALGAPTNNPVFTINAVNTPFFNSSGLARFTVGQDSQFKVTANVGTISDGGATLPNGLTFIPGNPAVISGTPAAGTGGLTTLLLTATNATATNGTGSSSQLLTIEIDQPPTFSSPATASFYVGIPGSFPVTTYGYPSQSTQPNLPAGQRPANPSQDLGMWFGTNGTALSALGLTASNLNSEGFRTGTLTIHGTPTAASVGVHPVTIQAVNGVAPSAQQTLNISIMQTAAAPGSSTTCNGVYFGTFSGDLHVANGESCTFIGGAVTGSINVDRTSTLVLNNTNVGGSVTVGGGFDIGPATTIGGNLSIMNVQPGSSPNQVCGTNVKGNLGVSSNTAAIQIGSSAPSVCPGNTIGTTISVSSNSGATAVVGNTIGGYLYDDNNTGATSVLSNKVSKTLACSGNATITGGGNTAAEKTGQCATF